LFYVSQVSRVMSTVTHLLNATEAPLVHAPEVMAAIYAELRQMAGAKMASEPAGLTFQATELVHEAWMRLSKAGHWKNRGHFFGTASEAMRRILIDQARRRLALRRGSGAVHESVDEIDLPAPGPDEEVLAVDEALAALEQADPDLATLVKLRYFTGLTIEEVAEVLGISEATTKRRWAYARAWLAQCIREGNAPEGVEA
jgi:RNA polymerase sigma factor (TIGR02999 family)